MTGRAAWRKRALQNYRRFYRLERARFRDVEDSLGGVAGWAVLTLPREEEGAWSAWTPQSPSAAFQQTLLEASYEDCLERLALQNYESFHGLEIGGASLADVNATAAGVPGWAMPTFSQAKRNYEEFRNLRPGSASLREVVTSSAGVLGWSRFRCRPSFGFLSNSFSSAEESESHEANESSDLDP
jgi:hypothetical protein